MPAVRVSRLLPLLVFALALLFAVLEPEPSRGMVFPLALGFWVVHIGIGLLLAVAATRLLGPPMSTRAPVVRLLAGGVLGSLAFAPVALGLEALLPAAASPAPPDGLLDRWELRGGPLALLAEWLQLAPSYLASWLLINAIPLTATPSLDAAPAMDPAAAIAGPARHDRVAADPARSEAALAAAPAITAVAAKATGDEPDFLAQLPPAIGRDVIVIQSDLHYLQVRTPIGRATLLGSLATAEASLGALGLRVHRSYWVALRHVRRIARSRSGWHCVLSDGTRVPVSRRRAGEVRERLGVDFVVEPLEGTGNA
jgi:hypothetical protein